jgi:hypothetical protein
MDWLFLGNVSPVKRLVASAVAGALAGALILGLSQLLPSPPVARISCSPESPFPGDTVTIKNLTDSEITRCAVWVTASPWPSSKSIAGESLLRHSCPREISFTIPVALRANQEFWAHIVVESPQYPFVSAQSTPSQIETIRIPIDRAPGATLTVTPLLTPEYPSLFLLSISTLLLVGALGVLRLVFSRLSLRARHRKEATPRAGDQNGAEAGSSDFAPDEAEKDDQPGDPVLERLDTLISTVANLKDDRLSAALILSAIANSVAFLSSLTSILSFFGIGR